MWTISSVEYVKAAVRNVEETIKDKRWKMPSGPGTPMSSGFEPELDGTPELGPDDHRYYQELIGVLRWATELGRVERQRQDGTTERVSCSDQTLVEEGCMQENQDRYDQTRFPYPTPPMRPPLYQEFTGPLAEEYVSDLLEGRWDVPPSVRPPTRAFLNQCRSKHAPLNIRVNRDSNTKFWKRNPEMKGSEPHGLHNGHYKVATFSPLLSACDAACRDIPLTTGCAPIAWRNLMNFAIEKKPGDFRVKKMRTIQMMDAEFQANNKLVGKTAMEFAERHSLIPPGQCGSRKKHQAIDLALSKTLVWDQLILRRQPAGWVLNDAKSCFDRVVHWVAQVAL